MTQSTKINTSLLLWLSLFGAAIATLTVGGLTRAVEPWLWLIGGSIAVVAILKKSGSHYFAHGLFVGLIWGFLAGLIQSLFFESYLANNPAYANTLEQINFMPPRYFSLISSPIFGIFTGIIIGGVATLLYHASSAKSKRVTAH